MSSLSIAHILAALVAVGIGVGIFASRKGDRRHRVLGWWYVGLMSVGLVAILVRGATTPRPFHGYALIIALGIVAAVLASIFRSHIRSWRAWHAALMSFSMLGASVAIGGVVGGLAMGLGNGPAYFRMFNVVIVVITLAGLWLILTRSVIWGARPNELARTTRLHFGIGALAVSAGLVISQWALLSR